MVEQNVFSLQRYNFFCIYARDRDFFSLTRAVFFYSDVGQNQTGETLSRENRIGIASGSHRGYIRGKSGEYVTSTVQIKHTHPCGYMRERRRMAGKGVYLRFERMDDFYRGVAENELKTKNMQQKCEIICVCPKKVVILYAILWNHLSQLTNKHYIHNERRRKIE